MSACAETTSAAPHAGLAHAAAGPRRRPRLAGLGRLARGAGHALARAAAAALREHHRRQSLRDLRALDPRIRADIGLSWVDLSAVADSLLDRRDGSRH